MKLIIKISVIILLTAIASSFFYFGEINSVSENSDKAIIEIAKGENVASIAKKLKDKDLINSEFWFKAHLKLNGLDSELQAGSFEVDPETGYAELIKALTEGRTVSREIDVKIIEGWSIEDIRNHLSQNSPVDADRYSSLAYQDISLWAFGFEKPGVLEKLPQSANLEGYLFPDTYRLFIDSDAESLIKRQLDNFARKLSPNLLDEIEKQGRSLHEVIILASLIEKEVRDEKDMKIVSGILLKRLRVGMRLQLDSTINYITGKNDPSPLYRDLERDSPYNTYKNDGLPPGPICNPGMSAILASIFPEESPYFFYLNRQDTGETIFSRTYEEHNANKYKYLK